MANRALGDAERLGYSLLATVSLDELLYVHDADYSGLNFFTLEVLTPVPYSVLNLSPLTDTTHPQIGDMQMFRSHLETNEYLESINDLPGTDIAGMMMFDALTQLLPYIEGSGAITSEQKKVLLRQIAKQADKIADRYHLDHSTDFSKYGVAA